MRSTLQLALANLVCLTACDGIGLAVVGERPMTPPMPSNECWEVRCDEILDPPTPRWEAPADLGATRAACLERTSRSFAVEDMPLDPDASFDLRCADVRFDADAPFDLDLRNVPLTGARISIASQFAGHVTLGGNLSQLDLEITGPIDVDIVGGALSESVVSLGGELPDRLATLTTDWVVVTDVVVAAPYGLVRAHESALARVDVRAVELSLEVSSMNDGRLEADHVSLLDATVSRTDLAVGRLVAAAGELDAIDVVRCDEITLAAIDLSSSHVARCTGALFLDDADVDGSWIEADVLGSVRMRRTGLAGARVQVESSRLTLVALCGVESLDVSATSIECPSCQPAAPAEICGAPANVEPFCPGFESSPCDGMPRPAATPLLTTTP